MSYKQYIPRGQSHWREARGGGTNFRGRGRGRGRGGRGRGQTNYSSPPRSTSKTTNTAQGLQSSLRSLHNQSYGAYKELKFIGWQFDERFTLHFDRIQSDPYAPASNLRIRCHQRYTQIPRALFSNKTRNIACCDYLTRQFSAVCAQHGYDRRAKGPWSGKKGGDLLICRPSQCVLERTACFINEEFVEVRIDCALPGRGRRIDGLWAIDVLCRNLPAVIDEALVFARLNATQFAFHVDCVEDQQYLREVVLPKLGLVAFIANGSILPRKSGISDKPLSIENGAVPFEFGSTVNNKNKNTKKSNKDGVGDKVGDKDGMFVSGITLPNHKDIVLSGLGIARGVTLIIGGGFHGKSTLLNAMQCGVYNHIPGDGREYVVCVSSAAKIRSEDGRFINNCDITPFINNLPQKRSCTHFVTANASGSTSMAANIVEHMEAHSDLLLFDEDLCATNFMVRDETMARLMADTALDIQEPITPLISKIRCMYSECGVSSILVIGGVGSYFGVADRVVLMNHYRPFNVTANAHKACGLKHVVSEEKQQDKFGARRQRYLSSESFPKQNDRLMKIKCERSRNWQILYGDDYIDLKHCAQIMEHGQLICIARCLEYVKQKVLKGSTLVSLCDILQGIEHELDADHIDTKMDVLNRVHFVKYANELSNKMVRPRPQEIVAAFNRLRSLTIYDQNGCVGDQSQKWVPSQGDEDMEDQEHENTYGNDEQFDDESML